MIPQRDLLLGWAKSRVDRHLDNLEKSGNLTWGQGKVKRSCKVGKVREIMVVCYCSCNSHKINIIRVLLSKVNVHTARDGTVLLG